MNDKDRLPSPSGARLSGDDFQHLLTWIELVRLLWDEGVCRVGFEVGQSEVGVVDDLIVHRTDGQSDRYAQIKFAVDDTTPLTWKWFITPIGKTEATPLGRFHQSFVSLSGADDAMELELITNRPTATGDPILIHRRSLDGLLVPRLFSTKAAESVKARSEWAAAIGLSEEELREFLGALVISPSKGTVDDLIHAGRGAMAMAGLRHDAEGVAVAVGLVRRLIEEGVRSVDRAAMEELVAGGGLGGAPRYSTLVVQEIDESPLAALASASVDWVELFDGETPDTRRRTKDPGDWEEVMRPDLRAAINRIRTARDLSEIRLEGAYRLASAFLLGFEISERSGVSLCIPYGDGDWSSSAEREELRAEINAKEVDQGDELAVAIAASADLAGDVERHIAEGGLPISRCLVISPVGGPGRASIPGAGAGRTFAESCVDICREAAVEADRLHLFLATPRPLAVMLGRVWNRLPPTLVYTDLNPGYAATYLVET